MKPYNNIYQYDNLLLLVWPHSCLYPCGVWENPSGLRGGCYFFITCFPLKKEENSLVLPSLVNTSV